jgi:hypothetical protein
LDRQEGKLLDFEFDDDANSQSFVCLYTSKQSEVAEEAVLGWVGCLFGAV